MEPKLPYLRIGQVWRRHRRWDNTDYTMYFRLKAKNSNNMWQLELLMSKPEVDPDMPKEEWWHRDRILEHMTFIANKANVDTVKVLFG